MRQAATGGSPRLAHEKRTATKTNKNVVATRNEMR